MPLSSIDPSRGAKGIYPQTADRRGGFGERPPANIRLFPYSSVLIARLLLRRGGDRLAASRCPPPGVDCFILPLAAADGAEGALQAKEAELTLFSGSEGQT